jgi:predicted NAD-dependent protein-ADP-ribosyltransferase YbiA (DUF1768 family)
VAQPAVADQIARAVDFPAVLNLSRLVTPRPNWNREKRTAVLGILRAKFSLPETRDLLLQTQARHLVLASYDR